MTYLLLAETFVFLDLSPSVEFGIAAEAEALPSEIFELRGQVCQHVHAFIGRRNKPFVISQTARYIEDSWFRGFPVKPTSVGYFVNVVWRPEFFSFPPSDQVAFVEIAIAASTSKINL
ncbi:MAG: hypothetical protein QOF72_3015 [Blastocatellia bacterium]|nr:hypothetical protein [Blastocatellia bacterium]